MFVVLTRTITVPQQFWSNDELPPKPIVDGFEDPWQAPVLWVPVQPAPIIGSNDELPPRPIVDGFEDPWQAPTLWLPVQPSPIAWDFDQLPQPGWLTDEGWQAPVLWVPVQPTLLWWDSDDLPQSAATSDTGGTSGEQGMYLLTLRFPRPDLAQDGWLTTALTVAPTTAQLAAGIAILQDLPPRGRSVLPYAAVGLPDAGWMQREVTTALGSIWPAVATQATQLDRPVLRRPLEGRTLWAPQDGWGLTPVTVQVQTTWPAMGTQSSQLDRPVLRRPLDGRPLWEPEAGWGDTPVDADLATQGPALTSQQRLEHRWTRRALPDTSLPQPLLLDVTVAMPEPLLSERPAGRRLMDVRTPWQAQDGLTPPVATLDTAATWPAVSQLVSQDPRLLRRMVWDVRTPWQAQAGWEQPVLTTLLQQYWPALAGPGPDRLWTDKRRTLEMRLIWQWQDGLVPAALDVPGTWPALVLLAQQDQRLRGRPGLDVRSPWLAQDGWLSATTLPALLAAWPAIAAQATQVQRWRKPFLALESLVSQGDVRGQDITALVGPLVFFMQTGLPPRRPAWPNRLLALPLPWSYPLTTPILYYGPGMEAELLAHLATVLKRGGTLLREDGSAHLPVAFTPPVIVPPPTGIASIQSTDVPRLLWVRHAPLGDLPGQQTWVVYGIGPHLVGVRNLIGSLRL
jgi:hypothetical protein